MECFVVFVTAPDLAEAEKIGRTVVEEKLAACANISPGLRSIYWWEGAVQSADEVLLIMKTGKPALDRLIGRVKELHSYQVPEVIALPIGPGNPDYLKWIEDSIDAGC